MNAQLMIATQSRFSRVGVRARCWLAAVVSPWWGRSDSRGREELLVKNYIKRSLSSGTKDTQAATFNLEVTHKPLLILDLPVWQNRCLHTTVSGDPS